MGSETLIAHLSVALRDVARAAYYHLFRLTLYVRCWFSDRWEKFTHRGPVPPALMRFRVSELLSVDEFDRIGSGCARLICEYLDKKGVDLSKPARILDFGCGCGRIAKWIIRGHRNLEFHGVDVDAAAIEWCSNNLHPGRFHATGPVPPLPFPRAHFDAIYCLSVFTHLNEEMQDLWLGELSRALKPTGLLLLTVHSDSAALSLDANGRLALKTTGFLHRTSTKLRGVVPEWYHTSWHSPEYISRRAAIWFEEVFYEPVLGSFQDFVLARGARAR